MAWGSTLAVAGVNSVIVLGGLLSHCGVQAPLSLWLEGSSIVVVGGSTLVVLCRGHLSSCGQVLFLNVVGDLLSGSDVQRCSLIVVMCWRLLSSHGRWLLFICGMRGSSLVVAGSFSLIAVCGCAPLLWRCS